MRSLLFPVTYFEEFAAKPSDDPAFLSADEAKLVAEYLKSFQTIVFTNAKLSDVFSEENDKVVPIYIETDGEWIWSRSLVYYVENYRVSPGEEFLTYFHSQNARKEQPTREECIEACKFLDTVQ